MTEEQINIAIALSVGWIPLGMPICAKVEWIHPNIEGRSFSSPPPYINSLDACAEFEAKLTEDEQQRNYAWYLIQICDPHEQFRLWKSPDELSIWEMSLSNCFTCASAKPIQRCEAYLRTIGKWTPSNQQPT